MQPVPLKKRILYYLALLPISLVFAYFFSIIAVIIAGDRGYAGISMLIVFLILHYIFGVIFLKTKLLVKIIVPIITAIISGGILFLMIKYDFCLQTRLLYYGYFALIIQVFFVIILVWEMTYQILKITTKAQEKR